MEISWEKVPIRTVDPQERRSEELPEELRRIHLHGDGGDAHRTDGGEHRNVPCHAARRRDHTAVLLLWWLVHAVDVYVPRRTRKHLRTQPEILF